MGEDSPLLIPTERWAKLLPWNPLSSKQVLEYLKFKGYPIPRDRKDRKKETTNDEGLWALIDKLGGKEDLLERVLRCRKINKGIGYLYDTFLGSDGRLHSEFTFLPETGRLSSRRPNLQNQPQGRGGEIEAAVAEAIRSAVIPTPGCTLIEVDWKAIEALLVGFFAGDPDYMQAAKIGVHDIFGSHLLVRKGILAAPKSPYDADIAEWVSWFKSNHGDTRAVAKKRIHAGAYGQGAQNMAKDLGLPVEVVRELDLVFAAMAPRVAKWQNDTRWRAHAEGQLTNPFGYTLNFWNVFEQRKNGTWGLAKEAWKALAFLPQSTGAAMCREAVLDVFAHPLHGKTFWLLVPIHDSLFLECLAGHEAETIKIVRDIMQKPWPELGGLSVEVETKTGRDWGSMKIWKEQK
jgi:DNA polymerase I